MILNARKGINENMMVKLKVKRYASEVQSAKTNLIEKNKYDNDEKEEWRKNLGLPNKMDINVVHRYSHLGEQMLRIIYNALGVTLTYTLQFCDYCARLKEKPCVVRKETYTEASNPGEMIFVDTTGTFTEILIGNRYCIGVVENYSRY